MAIPNSVITWPRTFASTSYVLRVTCNSVTENLTFPGSGTLVADRYYWLQGDGLSDVSTDGGRGDLILLLEECLQTHSEGASFFVSLSTSGYVTVTCSAAFQILWAHGSTTLDDAIWGFSGSTSSGTTTTAPNRAGQQFFPGRPLTIGLPDAPQVLSAAKASLSGLIRRAYFGQTKSVREFTWDLVDKSQTWAEYASAMEPSTAEAWWLEAASKGYPFRYHADAADRADYQLYRAETDLSLTPDSRVRGAQKWRVSIRGRRAED